MDPDRTPNVPRLHADPRFPDAGPQPEHHARSEPASSPHPAPRDPADPAGWTDTGHDPSRPVVIPDPPDYAIGGTAVLQGHPDPTLPPPGAESDLPDTPRRAGELHPRWEIFARAYAQGRGAAGAARIAGYSRKYARQSGWRLMQEPAIRLRVEEFECVHGRLAVKSRAGYLVRLETLYRDAVEAGRHATAFRILREQARVRRIGPDDPGVHVPFNDAWERGQAAGGDAGGLDYGHWDAPGDATEDGGSTD